jgi:hypothetical protein
VKGVLGIRTAPDHTLTFVTSPLTFSLDQRPQTASLETRKALFSANRAFSLSAQAAMSRSLKTPPRPKTSRRPFLRPSAKYSVFCALPFEALRTNRQPQETKPLGKKLTLGGGGYPPTALFAQCAAAVACWYSSYGPLKSSITPRSKCQMRVATSSIKSWSCVTSSTVPS